MNYRQGIIVTTFVILAVSGISLAQDGAGANGDVQKPWSRHNGPGRGGSPEEMIMRIADHLDLDETQRQEIRNIMEAAKPSFSTLRERSRDSRQAFLALDVSDPDYGANLQDLSAQSGELAAELTLLAGQLRADVSAVLTDEQRQKLEERMAGFSDRGSRMRRHRSSQ
jgi:Spy/CpxP family protein refolding chaperone